LGMPALRPDLRTRGDEDFRFRVRTHDGADIAPVEHGAWLALRELALETEQRFPDFEVGGDDRSGRRDILGPQILLMHEIGLEPARCCECGRFILWILARLEHRKPDHAVEGSRIEEMKIVAPRQRPGERALAGRRGSIDRDDHGQGSMRQPMPFISVAKCGKLVAMVAPSSTLTGFLAASPMTRK